MKSKERQFYKKYSIFVLCIIMLLSVVMVLNTPHVGTLLNHRVVSQSFDDIINQTSLDAKKDSRAEDFKIPTSWWSDGAADSFDGGDGTTQNPYLISTPQQLALMANKINNEGGPYLSASYNLTADIDMSERFWAPMGTWDNDRAFRGTLDGGTHKIGADGVDHGTVHTISGLIMKNRGDITNGTMVGFFGVLGDQSVITNLIIDNSIGYLDYEIELSERVTLAVLASQVKNDATVLFQNVAVLNSGTFAPKTLSEDGQDGVDFIQNEVKSGVFVGWQQGVEEYQGSAKGVIYMNDAHARMSSVMINIYLDLSGWDMSPDTRVNSFGGLIGEARQVDIQNSSFEGIIGIEVVRKDRNMDNAQYIYNAGGAVGTMDPYHGHTSYFKNVDLSGSIYLDTFKNEYDGFNRNLASAQSASARDESQNRDETSTKSDNGVIPWSADVRQIGGIIGDANIWGDGPLDIQDVTASFFVDAPKGNNIQLGDQPDTTLQSDVEANQLDTKNNMTQLFSQDSSSTLDSSSRNLTQQDFEAYKNDPKLKASIEHAKEYAEENSTLTAQNKFEPHTTQNRGVVATGSDGSNLEGPPSAPAGPIVFALAAPAMIILVSEAAALFIGVFFVLAPIMLVTWYALWFFAIVLIVAIVVFAVLFAFWGADKPKWESNVYVGSAIGSKGRGFINLTNVHVANVVIASDTMYSSGDSNTYKKDAHNTTPTQGMITSQPESPSVNNIGDKVSLSVSGKGTVMSDGKPGVDSVLEYQWYYNTIDSNNILDGTEVGLGGAKTVKVEGATDRSLDLTVDWVGSRYYFVKQTNHVLEFRGNVNSVTARVGNKKVSIKPAEITKQPTDISINVGTSDQTLSVEATATGDIDYQWYYNTEASTDGAVLLAGGNKSEFVPYQNQAGTYYYFVIVTVSINVSGKNETLRSDTYSDFAKVQAQAIANDISISVQPEAEKTVEKNTNAVLGVQVDLSTVNGTLGYQWYETDSSGSIDQAIIGATSQSLLVDTSRDDTTRLYYVVVCNTVADSTTTVKSNLSKVVTTKDVALEANIIESPKDSIGISNQTGISLSVYATSDQGTIRYQWYKTDSKTNMNNEHPLIGETDPTLVLNSSSPSLDYYYVELSVINSNDIRSVQYTKPVSVEFKDYTSYYFESSLDILNKTTITSTQSENKNTVDLSATLDTSDIVGKITYQWYVSDSVDMSDAVAIKGAVGSVWRVDLTSDKGTKYYSVKITNSAQVYSYGASLSRGTAVYYTQSNSITVAAQGINLVGSDDSILGMILIVSSVATIMIALMSSVIIITNKKKQNRYYNYSKYGQNNNWFL